MTVPEATPKAPPYRALAIPPKPPVGEAARRELVERGGRGDLGKTIIVQDGDTLERLARRIYGRVDDEILVFVQKHNPAISDIDLIRTGWELYFPPLPETEE